MPDQEHAEPREPLTPGTSRRGMLRGAAGLGAAGLAAGMFGEMLTAGSAQAATAKGTDAPAAADATHDQPLVVHIDDARTGVVDLYTGTQHVRFTDHQLAARLAKASR